MQIHDLTVSINKIKDGFNDPSFFVMLFFKHFIKFSYSVGYILITAMDSDSFVLIACSDEQCELIADGVERDI